MEVLTPVMLLLAGVGMVALGTALLSRSMHRLRRAGVFQGLFWASFRRFAGYRMRSLRPAGSMALGAILVGAGLATLYVGLTTFYGSRLGRLSG